MKKRHTLTLITLSMVLATTGAMAKPLKVYILSGQSNMQGKARPSTLPAMAMDPASKALHDKMVDAEGNIRVHEDIQLSYLTSSRGKSVVTNGSLGANAGSFGPELGFGVTMHEKLGEPILIIKTAWGGKDINTDFRPPSAGPYYPDPSKVEDRMGNKGRIPAEKLIEAKEKKQHRYYNLMMEHVKKVLANPGEYHPAYDPKEGYEVAGFVWFQGWNDMISDHYPKLGRGKRAPREYSDYSNLMAHFIRDVRKDLDAPKMPFVIGVMGVGGNTDGDFQKAQAAPAEMPEFKGNVAAVLTGKYWDTKLAELDSKKKSGTLTKEEQEYLKMAVSNASFHYLGSAKIYSCIGEALAESILEMNPQ